MPGNPWPDEPQAVGHGHKAKALIDVDDASVQSCAVEFVVLWNNQALKFYEPNGGTVRVDVVPSPHWLVRMVPNPVNKDVPTGDTPELTYELVAETGERVDLTAKETKKWWSNAKVRSSTGLDPQRCRTS